MHNKLHFISIRNIFCGVADQPEWARALMHNEREKKDQRWQRRRQIEKIIEPRILYHNFLVPSIPLCLAFQIFRSLYLTLHFFVAAQHNSHCHNIYSPSNYIVYTIYHTAIHSKSTRTNKLCVWERTQILFRTTTSPIEKK